MSTNNWTFTGLRLSYEIGDKRVAQLGQRKARHIIDRLNDMQIGYMRVSKADGSQVVDLQRDALLVAGVKAEHLYEDQASGRRDDRPGLATCLKALREGDALLVWKLLYSGKTRSVGHC